MEPKRKDGLLGLVLLLAMLLPVVALFMLLGSAIAGTYLFWLILMLGLFSLWMTLRLSSDPGAERERARPRMLHGAEQPEAVRQEMDVRIATEQEGVRVFRGRLLHAPAESYGKLREAFSDRLVLLQEDSLLGAAIALVPRKSAVSAADKKERRWLNWVLLIATLLTTTWVGAAYQGVNLLRQPGYFIVGLPYAVALMGILGLHELGHYFTAKRRGMRVSPPYFIPLPFALGTFGAFIRMREPSQNRRDLFDVGIAGPLAGLAVAIPALMIGLRSSLILPAVEGGSGVFGGISVGSSILLALLSKLSLGHALSYGYLVRLSPLAFAGWLGLLVTALNLMPIGQLDGGHIAHAMFGMRKGDVVGHTALALLFVLALFVWPGLLIWAIVVFLIAGRTQAPLNDLTPLPPGRRRLGYLAFLLLALIILPLPAALWPLFGIYHPQAEL